MVKGSTQLGKERHRPDGSQLMGDNAICEPGLVETGMSPRLERAEKNHAYLVLPERTNPACQDRNHLSALFFFAGGLLLNDISQVGLESPFIEIAIKMA